MVVRAAFRTEAGQLVRVLRELTGVDLDRPTRCPPWTVRDLVAHVRTATGRLTGMLAAPPPPAPEVDALGYYSPAKFAPDTDAERVDAARREARRAARHEGAGPAALADELDRTWRETEAAVAAAPPGRLVRTRHGDAMTVTDFLVTRVVELGVHGLDLAAAVGRPPWLTGPAETVIADLLYPVSAGVAGRLGWDRRTLIMKAAGRAPLTTAERVEVELRGVRWPSLG